jgi:pyruvate/2-oxoglutarate dehydrogenase complex dihydrolipoamide dehydrogenase (E3) component
MHLLLQTHTAQEDFDISDLDMIIMATGRTPRTKGLGLEDLGVKLSKFCLKGIIRKPYPYFKENCCSF